jgi:superfamily II DNA or RNA helicase
MPKAPERVKTSDYKGGLDEHQLRGVNIILDTLETGRSKGAMIADGTGTGKTRMQLVLADQFSKTPPTSTKAMGDIAAPRRVLILTQSKPIIEGNFEPQAKALGLTLKRVGVKDEPRLGGESDANIEIGTYNDLTAGRVGKGKYALVIFDESQNLKNVESGRSIAAFGLDAEYKVFATATPLEKPVTASYFMAEITGRSPAAIQRELGFVVHEAVDASGVTTRWPETIGGRSWQDVLNGLTAMRDEAIARGAMVRREYPFYGEAKQERAAMPPEVAQQQADTTAYWQARITSARSTKIRAQFKGALSQALGRIAEAGKYAKVKEIMERELAEGRQVIVMAEGVNTPKASALGGHHVETVIERLARDLDKAGIPWATLHGSGNKTREVAKFQKGEAKVALATPQSGGVGIDLDDIVGNAPRTMILVTPNWSAEQIEQAIGRISRRNTRSPSRIIEITSNTLGDQRRMSVLQRKISALRRIQAGVDPDVALGLHPDSTGPPPGGGRGPGGNRRGMVSLEPIVKTVELGLQAAKWTAEHTAAGARWLLYQFGTGMKALGAMRALQGRFGNGVRKVFKWVYAKYRDSAGLDRPELPAFRESRRPLAPEMALKLAAELRKRPILKTRQQYELEKHRERRRRFGRIKAILKGDFTEDSIPAILGALKGPLARVRYFEPLASAFSKEERTAILQYIGKHKMLSAAERQDLVVVMNRMMHEGYLPTFREITDLEMLFGVQFASTLVDKHMTKIKKWIALLGQAYNTPRTLKAGAGFLDYSSTMNQAGALFAAYPLRGARSIALQTKAMASEKYYVAEQHKLDTRRLAKVGRRAGLRFRKLDSAVPGEVEEIFRGDWMTDVPGFKHTIGVPIRQNNRAMNLNLNTWMAWLFDTQYANLRARGLRGPELLKKAKEVADFVNAQAGRYKTRGKWTGPLLEQVIQTGFFSPQLQASRAYMLYKMPQTLAMNPANLRRMAGRIVVANAVLAGAVKFSLYLMGRMTGADVDLEVNPWSTNFHRVVWKYKNGRQTVINMPSGVGSMIRFVAQATRGRTKDIFTGKIKKQSLGVTAQYFATSKLNPVPSLAINIAEGRRFGGRPMTLGGAVADLTVPITYETIYEAVQEHAAWGAWLGLPDTLGAGVGIQRRRRKASARPPGVAPRDGRERREAARR